MTRRSACLVVVLMVLLGPAGHAPAGEADDDPANDPAKDSVDARGVVLQDDAMALEFFEFLGEWETADGEWVDPGALLDLPETPPNATLRKRKEATDAR